MTVQPTTNITTPKKTNKTIYLVIFLGFLLLASAILQVLTPNVTTTENSWQEISPGNNSGDEVRQQLGEPKNIVQYDSYSVLEYESPYDTMPNEVAVDKNNLVIFIKEFLLYDENHIFNQYLEKYEQADLELYAPMISEAVKAHVFLDEGLVIIAHLQGTVEQKWYFIPTDEQTFLKSWEKELLQEQNGPEKFNNN